MGKSCGHTQTSSCDMKDGQWYQQQSYFCPLFQTPPDPVICTVTDRDTSCIQITLNMHCDYFFPQLGRWRKADWFKHFLFLGVPSLGVQKDQQTQETPAIIIFISCLIVFTSIFCHHDTSELLCRQRFVFRGSSRHYQVSRVHSGSAVTVCPSPPEMWQQKAEGTMHCDLLGVLDEGVAPSNLHGDSVHPLHSEHVRDAALQGDEGL